jgi:hypothetical protein
LSDSNFHFLLSTSNSAKIHNMSPFATTAKSGIPGRAEETAPNFDLSATFFNAHSDGSISTSGTPSCNRPTLIVLGGRDLTSLSKATKFCAFMLNELKSQGTPRLSAFYRGETLSDNRFEYVLGDFYKNGVKSELAMAAAKVARSLVRSHLLDDNDRLYDFYSDDNRKNVTSILADRFSKTTLFGFSFGSIILNALDLELDLELLSRGFNPQDSQNLRGRLAMITVGDVAFAGAQSDEILSSWKIPALHFASSNDIYAKPTFVNLNISDDLQMRVHRVTTNRLAIIAPLGQSFRRSSTIRTGYLSWTKSNALKEDFTGHTPPIYLSSETADNPPRTSVSLLVKALVEAMLKPAARPCKPEQLLRDLNLNS